MHLYKNNFKKVTSMLNLQFPDIAALARSLERPSRNDDKFATSYGPLISFILVAELDIIRFFPRVQSTSSCIFKCSLSQ